jgi:hypothetical protein
VDSPADQPAAERPNPRFDVLELLVKVAALVAVVLPIIGAGIRVTAFTLAGEPNPLEMAVAEPVSELIATALKAVLPFVGAFVLLAPTLYQEWPRPQVPPRYYHRLPTPLALAIGVLLMGGAAFFLPWPGGVIELAGVSVASYMLGFLSARRALSFYRVAAVVFLAAIVSALGGGINGVAVGDQISSYRFASSAALSDGKYALVGESDGFVYLQSCQRQEIVGVSQQEISSFEATKATSAWPSDSLYEIMFKRGSPKIGYRPDC